MNAIQVMLVSIVLVGSLGRGAAAQADREALARDLVVTMGLPTQMRQSMMTVYDQPGMGAIPEMKTVKLMQQSWVMRRFTDSVIVPPLARAYADAFTAAELQALLAFHKSALGRKLASAEDDLNRAYLATHSEIVRKHGGELQALMGQAFKAQGSKKP